MSRRSERTAEPVSVRKSVRPSSTVSALLVDDVVLGGGNAKQLTRLPQGCRMGDNSNAFVGGFRLWEELGPCARH